MNSRFITSRPEQPPCYRLSGKYIGARTTVDAICVPEQHNLPCYLSNGVHLQCSKGGLNVKHLIFKASKLGDFKRLIYWRSLILAVSLSSYCFSFIPR